MRAAINRMSSVVLACALSLILFGGCWYAVPPTGAQLRTRTERTRLCMGVPARITVDHATGEDEKVEAAIERAFALLASLDTALSDYMLASELNRVNAAAGGPPVAVGADLLSVLATARDVSRASDGAFDASVGPASLLWRETRRSGVLPGEDELARVRVLVDWRKVELDECTRTVRLAQPGMRLDLGGIGKGYAARRAVERLRDEGFPRAMVALSGDIAVGDAPIGARAWRIEVSPTDDRGLGREVDLERAAISTAGDAEQFVEIGGRRYSHIVDPRTALGTPGGVMVSVVSPVGEWADALDTAAVVMLSRGATESAVATMLAQFPGSWAIVERRDAKGRPVRSEIRP
jgi:thiamine biosynthesis lipoprotein